MLRRSLLLLFLLIIIVVSYASCENNIAQLSTADRIVLDKALDIERLLITSVDSNPAYEAMEYIDNVDSVRDKIRLLHKLTPRYACILSMNDDKEINSVLADKELPSELKHTLCFNRMHVITETYEGHALADFFDTTGIYSALIDEELPPMAYVVFLYDEAYPQAVVALSRYDTELTIAYGTFLFAENQEQVEGPTFAVNSIISGWGVNNYTYKIYNIVDHEIVFYDSP